MNGLYKLIRSEMKDLSPISGDAFLFFGKHRQRVKILKWDGDGFLLYLKSATTPHPSSLSSTYEQ